jgi:hypothetical protein
MAKRSAKVLKKNSFGACEFDKTSPAELSTDTSTVNFTISFEEALKLNLAIDECIRKLNTYNRATTRGKSAALALVIHFKKRRIRVMEGKLSQVVAVSDEGSA